MITKKIVWGKKPEKNTEVVKSSVNVSPSPNVLSDNTPSNCTIFVKSHIERKINIANKFEGIYTTDYDINSIHHSILDKFRGEVDLELPGLRIHLEKLQNELKGITKPLWKKSVSVEIDTLKQTIQKIVEQKEKNEYLDEIKDLIPRYLKIATEKKVISFRTKKIISDTELKNQMLLQEERLDIIYTYLDIARHYIKINLVQETPKKNECTQCKFDFNLIDEEIDFCPNCGLEHRVILKIPVYSESMGLKPTDEKNFMKEFKRFQGLQNVKLPNSLISDLDKYFHSYGFQTGEQIKSLPLNDDNERIGTSYDMMREALNKTNNSSYYEDINLILNLYWDYPLPDISHLEEGIMEDYKKLQQAFLEIDKSRTSSLNAQYRLYKQLQLRGYKCKSNQFKIIKTDIINQKYAELWKHMCTLAGFDYIPD